MNTTITVQASKAIPRVIPMRMSLEGSTCDRPKRLVPTANKAPTVAAMAVTTTGVPTPLPARMPMTAPSPACRGDAQQIGIGHRIAVETLKGGSRSTQALLR